MGKVLLHTLMVSKWSKFPAFYGTRRFITAFTRHHHLSIHSDKLIQSMSSHPIPWGPILILSFHLCRSLPSSLYQSGFVTKPCMHLASPPYVPHTPYVSFCLITRIIFDDEYQIMNLRTVHREACTDTQIMFCLRSPEKKKSTAFK